MKSCEITANVKLVYNHVPFDLQKVIEITEKVNEILVEVDPSLKGKLRVAKSRSICPVQASVPQR